MHGFDYNLDRCGLGHDRRARSGSTPTARPRTSLRAAAARAGLWGNHGYEARYDLLWQDENGDELDGDHTYELTLAPPPDVDAFWSLTMYDEPKYYLVANPIDRYSIGDRTPGLVVGADGSVTIYHAAGRHPARARSRTGCPRPPGKFRPVLRSYQPKGSTLDGRYQLPKVRKTVVATRAQRSTSRRPSNARPSVTSSAYSRSPPTGQPARDPRHEHAERLQQAREVHRGRFAFDVGVRREDDLVDAVLVDAREQLLDAQLLGTDAFDRRDRALQHVVATFELTGAFDRDDVARLLDDAERRARRGDRRGSTRTARLRRC